ncbi:MAG: 5' nucleotidase, NT5C type [Nitrosopumilaceae archaeon]
MKRIGLDLDGVCYNYSATACYLLNHYKEYDLDWTDTNSWNWLKDQIKKEDWDWLWSAGVKEGLFRYGSLFKGTAEAVKEISKLGKIVVITSRPDSAINDTIEWLAYMKFPVSELHIVGNGQNKAEFKPDVAIDDAPHNVLNYLKAGIDTVMPIRKYNKHCIGVDYQSEAFFIPVSSWDETIKFVKRVCD